MAISIVDHEIPSDSHNLYDVTIDSDQIHTLLTSSPAMVDSWISETLAIQTPPLIVGLDIEWRPNRNSSYENPVATLQLCFDRRCLIFQLIHASEIPRSLTDFLTDESFTFVGVGIGEDVEKLLCDYGLNVSNTVDLRNLAENAMGRGDLKNAGLKGLAKEVLGKEISKPKSVTMSRWDNEWLVPNQVKYACVDAFLSSEIGRHLSNRRESGENVDDS
ncbi:Werner Syndrome-like exonuclease [Momordica charantia]|uniref:Werner Syndrome-like exonuclease n=1 Tax=Momordica charantia TaxID=3673 RepID=A0A6J1D107_MOMCH|nr:Werner Syndrome-like exonuclease [Momordica charantia]